jgi:hypothetical protein
MAGCVTRANCQMIIAVGQGATAAQTINCDLDKESLANHRPSSLPVGGQRYAPTARLTSFNFWNSGLAL